MPLDPQIQAMLDDMATQDAKAPESRTVAENRESIAGLAAVGGEPEPVRQVSDLDAEVDGRRIPLRVYTPDVGGDAPLPMTLFFHGGGFACGDLDSQDPLARILASRSKTIVVSVHYRRPPEIRFPAAVEDSYAALTWIVANAATLGGDPNRIAVFGESAGGNLAAVTAQESVRRGGPPVALQVLAYPAVDRFDDSPSMTENMAGPFLSRAYLEWCWGCYLDTPDQGADPRVSPARADDLTGLPPAVIVTAENDPMRDQGNAYAESLRAAGVSVQHRVVAGATHAFLAFTGPVELARSVCDELGQAIATAFGQA